MSVIVEVHIRDCHVTWSGVSLFRFQQLTNRRHQVTNSTGRVPVPPTVQDSMRRSFIERKRRRGEHTSRYANICSRFCSVCSHPRSPK